MCFTFLGGFCVFSSCLFIDKMVSKSLGRTWHLTPGQQSTFPPSGLTSFWVTQYDNLSWTHAWFSACLTFKDLPQHTHSGTIPRPHPRPVTSGLVHLSNKDSHSFLTTTCSQPHSLSLSLIIAPNTLVFWHVYFRVPDPSSHSASPSLSSLCMLSLNPFVY